MLRQTVSQSVCQGVKFTLEPVTGSYILSTLLCCLCGAPSLTRGRVCLLQSLSSVFSPCQRFNIIYIVHVTCFKYVYNILDLIQHRLSTADHVAHTTTAV
jgi:hypothetical protein